MGNRNIPVLAKWIVVDLLESGRRTTEIQRMVENRMSKNTVDRIIHLYRTTGTVIRDPALYLPSGRPRTVDHDLATTLRSYIHADVTLYLDELQLLLMVNEGVYITLSSIERELARQHVTWKKAKKVAAEGNADRIIQYMDEVCQYTTTQLVFLDESACDLLTGRRNYGRASHGERAQTTQPLKAGPRYSFLPAVNVEGLINCEVIEGGYNKNTFFQFLEDTVSRDTVFRVMLTLSLS